MLRARDRRKPVRAESFVLKRIAEHRTYIIPSEFLLQKREESLVGLESKI
jgi:hypothetical protein